MNDVLYKACRFHKNSKKVTCMKKNLTRKQASDFCESYKSTKNSFVGFLKQ